MVPFGGTGVMLLAVLASGLVCGLLALVLARRLGWVSALAFAGLLWSLAVIAAATLIPANGPPGYLQPDEVQTACSFDIGGPAPDGFGGLFNGTQRMLNTALFVPSGALVVLAFGRWRAGWLLAPLGLLALAAYSFTIEVTQLELARIDRACDVTDMIDNVTGAVVGFVVGLVLLPLVRPWRHRQLRRAALGSRGTAGSARG